MELLKRSICLSICLMAFHSMIGAQSITFYANITDPATGQLPGHVWIGIREEMGDETTWGFYSDGRLQNEGQRRADISYTFKVPSLAPIQKIIQHYRSENVNYSLGVNDCRHFAELVARAAKLRTPSVGLQSPADWLAQLVDLN